MTEIDKQRYFELDLKKDKLNDSEKAEYSRLSNIMGADPLLGALAKEYQSEATSAARKEELRKQLLMGRSQASVDAFNIARGTQDLAKLGLAGEQMRQGKSELEQLAEQRPELAPFVRDQRLQQRIQEEDAQRRIGLSGASMQLAKDQILQNRLAQLNAAKQAGAGQAGIYGALAAQAGQQANRQALALAQANEQAQMNRNAVYDQLVRAGAAETAEARQRMDLDTIRRQSDWQKSQQGARAKYNVGLENVMNVAEKQPFNIANFAREYYNRDAQRDPGYLDRMTATAPVQTGDDTQRNPYSIYMTRMTDQTTPATFKTNTPSSQFSSIAPGPLGLPNQPMVKGATEIKGLNPSPQYISPYNPKGMVDDFKKETEYLYNYPTKGYNFKR